MPQRRVPWVKVRIDLPGSEKLAKLPDDAGRWGWVCVLVAAKTQRRMGVFAGRAHLVSVVGQAGPYVEDYVAAGLLHVAPMLCSACAARHVDDDLQSGDHVVHDYLVEQRDPTNADRQATYRQLQAALRALEAAGIDIPLTDKVQGHVTLTTVTPSTPAPGPASPAVTANRVTPDPSPIEPARHNGEVTGDSRARGTTVTTTVRETTTPKKKNASDERVVESRTREVAVDAPFLSDPNRAGRRGASIDRPLTPPPGILAATPGWRLPGGCRSYVQHQSAHLIIDGQAVCPPCEEEAGFNPAAPVEPASLWGGTVQ